MQARILLTAALGLWVLSAPAFTQEQSAAEDQASVEDPVLATVDGEEIRQSHLEAAARELPQQFRNMPIQMLQGVLLDRLIESRLLAQEAERRDLGEDPAVQEELERARVDVLRDALIRREIDQGLTEEKLQERYEQLKQGEDFAREEVHARHILLESEEEALQVIEQLNEGADFATLAEEKSTGPSAPSGGDLGYFTRDQVVPEFAGAAFALDPGQVTDDPVETQFGWHVIKVLDKRTAEPTFEETEPQLRQDVAREIVTNLVDDLRQDAQIERFVEEPEMPPAEGAEGEAGEGAAEGEEAAE